jgi:hypothetical protein
MLKDKARLEDIIKQIRDAGVTDQTLEDVAELLREETLAPQEVDAIKMALAQAMSKTIADRERREKERESERRKRRRRRAGRAVYVLAAAAILGGFLWLNVASARGGWGLSAVRIIALKCIPGTCEYPRCTRRGDQEKHYTLIGLTKETHHFCRRHVGEAPARIGQSEPGLMFLGGVLFTLGTAAFFLYAACRTAVVWHRWDKQAPAQAILLLLVACVALYVVPTVFSYLIGVGG